MKRLENLVPPLKLCKKIPHGEFDDSVFWRVWSAVEQRYILCQRGTGAFINTAEIPCPCGMRYTYPAPTSQEIMEALPGSFNTLAGDFYLVLIDNRHISTATGRSAMREIICTMAF